MEKALRRMTWLIGLLFFLAPLAVFAQNKVVVIPLFGDDPKSTQSVPAPVPKTGQTPTVPLDPAPGGSDGALQKGVAWPNPRFTDNGNGTVTDNLTNLVWVEDANCFGTKDWVTALADVNGLANGQCGLNDASEAGDWRLPNRRELFSLIDDSQSSPALPSGHSFDDVNPSYY